MTCSWHAFDIANKFLAINFRALSPYLTFCVHKLDARVRILGKNNVCFYFYFWLVLARKRERGYAAENASRRCDVALRHICIFSQVVSYSIKYTVFSVYIYFFKVLKHKLCIFFLLFEVDWESS